MSDEFEQQQNPDNVPGEISTGYQTQNTNSEISRQGIEKSIVNNGAVDGDIDIEISGGVDINGVIFSCKNIVPLTVPVGVHYIKLVAGSSVDRLTPELQTSRGVYDDTKFGYYDSGDRVLNWQLESFGGVQPVNITRLVDSSNKPATFPDGVKTVNINLKTKVLETGSWNMDQTGGGDSSIVIPHLISDHSKILDISVMIIRDYVSTIGNMDIFSGKSTTSQNFPTESVVVSTTEVALIVDNSSGFNSSEYSSLAHNRGRLLVTYEA